jgi:PAS domain S-box-containing protein
MTVEASDSRRFSAILRSVAEAIVATDPEGIVTLINPAAERLFGKTAAQTVGKPLHDLHSALRLWLDRAVQGAPSRHLVFEFEIGQERDRQFSATLSPVQGDDDALTGWVVVLQEITHLKKAEQWKVEAMQAATHDLRNPLNLTNGALNLLRDSLRGATPEQLECVTMIKSGLDRMSSLVDQLLNLDQLDARADLSLVGIALDRVVHSVVEEARLAADEKGVRLELRSFSTAQRVMGDENWLHRAATNLVSNALKYTPRGGQITVTYRESDGQGICEVADTGPGISAEAQTRLFERFYRVRNEATRRTSGTGLGLAIVKTIVERHSGRVWVSSQEGVGSTFGFSVPLAAEP